MATFLKNINMISRSYTLFADGELGKISPLKGYHAKYLLAVCNNPAIPQDKLAENLFVHKSNVARQIAQLEKLGLVRRITDPMDRRVSLVHPTDEGEEIVEKIRAINGRWREIICEGFSEEEKDVLYGLTERMYKNAVKFMYGGGSDDKDA